ncbi:MAG: YacL family protein [Pseudomonadales bacterium]|nr:YacL family protein [Pseudomonadales bacterium]
MQYQFSRDSQNNAIVHLDAEDNLIAYWLMSNYSQNNADLQRLLNFSKKLQQREIDDFQISQQGYYLQLNSDSAKLTALSTLKDPTLNAPTPDDCKMDFDNMTECNIDLADLNALLADWQAFLNT